MNKIYCYICYTINVDEDYVCDSCDNHSRKKSLTKSMIRDNKLLLLLN